MRWPEPAASVLCGRFMRYQRGCICCGRIQASAAQIHAASARTYRQSFLPASPAAFRAARTGQKAPSCHRRRTDAASMQNNCGPGGSGLFHRDGGTFMQEGKRAGEPCFQVEEKPRRLCTAPLAPAGVPALAANDRSHGKEAGACAGVHVLSMGRGLCLQQDGDGAMSARRGGASQDSATSPSASSRRAGRGQEGHGF